MARSKVGQTIIGLALPIVMVSGIGGHAASLKRLTPAEAEACQAKGGYQSRGSKGHPFCQFRYGDAGRACSGKADCQGQCLFSLDGSVARASPGEIVTGRCEAERVTFGCHASVEGGTLSADGICVD